MSGPTSSTEDVPAVEGVLRALANPNRLAIVEWLAAPRDHFPPQRDGDLVEDGVCINFITDKIGLSQPSVTAHMQTLAKAGLVTAKPIKNWVFYKLDRGALADAIGLLGSRLGLDIEERTN